MKSAIPYLIFGVIYFVAVSLLGATLGNLTEGVVSAAVELLTPFAAAPLALLVARGAGALAAWPFDHHGDHRGDRLHDDHASLCIDGR